MRETVAKLSELFLLQKEWCYYTATSSLDHNSNGSSVRIRHEKLEFANFIRTEIGLTWAMTFGPINDSLVQICPPKASGSRQGHTSSPFQRLACRWLNQWMSLRRGTVLQPVLSMAGWGCGGVRGASILLSHWCLTPAAPRSLWRDSTLGLSWVWFSWPRPFLQPLRLSQGCVAPWIWDEEQPGQEIYLCPLLCWASPNPWLLLRLFTVLRFPHSVCC